MVVFAILTCLSIINIDDIDLKYILAISTFSETVTSQTDNSEYTNNIISNIFDFEYEVIFADGKTERGMRLFDMAGLNPAIIPTNPNPQYECSFVTEISSEVSTIQIYNLYFNSIGDDTYMCVSDNNYLFIKSKDDALEIATFLVNHYHSPWLSNTAHEIKMAIGNVAFNRLSISRMYHPDTTIVQPPFSDRGFNIQISNNHDLANYTTKQILYYPTAKLAAQDVQFKYSDLLEAGDKTFSKGPFIFTHFDISLNKNIFTFSTSRERR